MEENKLHYKDALIAAYMAREFGVKYDLVECPHVMDDFILENIPYDYLLGEDAPEVKTYIHPDSLHIFEPQDGDRNIEGYLFWSLFSAWVKDCGVDDDGEPILLFRKPHNLPITQRDGKQFFMPETN